MKPVIVSYQTRTEITLAFSNGIFMRVFFNSSKVGLRYDILIVYEI